MAKGTRVAGSAFDQTYLDTDASTEVHRDYGAHFFRWGFSARLLPGKTVLDAGCGGNFMLGKVSIDHGRMQMRPKHYVGVDLSPLPAVRTMHKTVIGSFNFIERHPELVAHFGKFDVVTSFEVVEHMPTAEGHAFIRAMAACLRPAGTLLISTPKNEGARMAKNHIHEWSGRELQAALEESGLTVKTRYGTYADVKDLERAARERFPEALQVMQRLSAYYCNDVLSCFLAPLFPEESKNNLWVCGHPDPNQVEPGPVVTEFARTWPVTGDEPEGKSKGVEAGADRGSAGEDDGGALGPVVLNDNAVASGETGSPAPASTPLVEGPPPGHVVKRDLPDVLSINSYAGSILLGSRMAQAPVVASFEDCGYGSQWQKANFPDLPLVWKREGWPEKSLEDLVVVAHPPCAAFSVQAIGTRTKHDVVHGLSNPAFKETVDVLEYAMGHSAQVVAIESVQGAMEGARQVHDELAAKHGYHLFRVLQNAATFGVPQWRPRFWAIFMRRDLGTRFATWHTPVVRTVSHVLDGHDLGPNEPKQDLRLEMQRDLLVKEFGREGMREILATPGSIGRAIMKKLGSKDTMDIQRRLTVGTYENVTKHNPKMNRFVSATVRVLDPDGFANVLVRDTWWVYRGRNVSPAEYRALMGFPRDYVLDDKFRGWLSKGVVPAVAAWIMDLCRRNVAGTVPAGARWLAPGETADYQIDKGTWHKLAAGEKVADPFGQAPPELIRRPAHVTRVLGPDAVVVEDEELVECTVVEDVGTRADVPTSSPKRRAKRVIQDYILERDLKALERGEIEAAFESKKALICPSLAGVTWEGGIESMGTLVRVTIQYEPPNAGGGRHDTDRITARAAKKLGAAWRRA